METNQEYWQKKTKERALDQFAKVDDLQEQLKKEYEKALSELQKQIADFYMRYAAAAGVPYKDALLLLNKTEIKGFRNTLEGYLERLVAGDKELKAELAAMSIKERITRLDALMARIKFECSSLAGYQDEKLGSSLAEICQDNYYRTIFDIQQGLGISASFTALNPKTVQEVIRYPWSGEMFSDRIWNNRNKLVRNLRQELVQGFIQGKSVQGMANALAKSMDSSYKRALSVIWTESAYVINKSTLMGYMDSGVVEEYEFMAKLDMRTSSICQARDGDRYKLSEAKPGINIPPLHPHCRSTIVPVIKDYVENSGNSDKIEVGTKLSEFETVIENSRPKLNEISKHAEKRLSTRNITSKDAQEYIDSSLAAILQSKTKTVKYISEKGTAIINNNGKLVTAFSSDDFDESEKTLLNRLKG